jgi:hypothetical protein
LIDELVEFDGFDDKNKASAKTIRVFVLFPSPFSNHGGLWSGKKEIKVNGKKKL